MPKIKMVFDPDETALCRWEHASCRVEVTDSVRDSIRNAVRQDHPLTYGTTYDNTDDVGYALDDYPLAAAWLLRGATETPALGAVIDALVFNGHTVDLETEFNEWTEWQHGQQFPTCPECDAVVYRNWEYGCDNCGASLALDVDSVFDAYVKSALWSELDDNGRPLDDRFDVDDIDPDALDDMRDDVKDFVTGNVRDLAGMDPAQAGHDFWLTRNRHGAGFWGRGLGERGERLTTSSHVYGESNLYVGDNGRIYVA